MRRKRMIAALPGYPFSMDVSIALPADLTAPAAARALIRRTLPQWGQVDRLDDVEMVASELVTNALRHGAAPVVFWLAAAGDRLLVAVRDSDPEHVPQQRAAGPDDSGGRGMQLVGAVSLRWGFDQDRSGKVVWAELGEDLPRPSAEDGAPTLHDR